MKRRDFLKFLAVTPVVAALPALAKADTITVGIDLALPGADKTVITDFKPIWSEKLLTEIANAGKTLDRMDIPTTDRYVVPAGTGEVVHFENLIDPKTFKRVRMRRTKNGWERA